MNALSSRTLRAVSPAERETYALDRVVCRKDVVPREGLSFPVEAVEEARFRSDQLLVKEPGDGVVSRR